MENEHEDAIMINEAEAAPQNQPVPAPQAQPAPSKSKGNKDSNEPGETPEELTHLLTFGKKLGEGTYGVVFRATSKPDGGVLAVKDIKIDHIEDGIPSTAIREIAVL